MAAINMNQTQFNKLIGSDKPVLVDYWAPWCSYCRRIGSAYEKIAQQYEGDIVVGKVNIDEEPLLAESQQIDVIPTLILYRDGKAQGFIVAPESKAQIDQFIRETLEQ